MILGSMLVLVLMLSACAGAGSPSPSATVVRSNSPPAPTSGEPSISVSPSPDGTPDEATRPAFDELSLAAVLASGLDVHADDARSATVGVDAVDGTSVRVVAGDHLLVMSTPTWGDGQWWLQIATDRGHGAIGWVPTGTLVDPYLKQDASWCPSGNPSFAELVALTRIEQRGCYGAAHLTFDAYRATIQPDAGLGGACDPGPYPEWLVCDNINYNYVNRDGGYDWELKLHFDPATGIAPTGLHEVAGANPLLRITGHLADPAADQCAPRSVTAAGGWGSRWLDCTTAFVVEKIETP
jgi:hypothetical protein